jgi:hypothetical protein
MFIARVTRRTAPCAVRHFVAFWVLGCSCISRNRARETTELLLRTCVGVGRDCDVTTVVGILCKIINHEHVVVLGRWYNAGQFAHNLYAICTKFVRNFHAICTQFAHNLHTICMQFAHNLYTICTQFSYNLHTTCT